MKRLMVGRIGIAISVLALVSVLPAAAQANGASARSAKESVPSEKNTPAQASSSSQETSAPGQHDTIKVHGHWVIVIRNANGSVDSRHEFENAFFQGVGDKLLAKIFTRTAWVGLWAIELEGLSNGTAPCSAGGTAAACEIGEPNVYPLSGAQIFDNLTVQVGGASQTTIVLSGSAKSTNGGQIATVFTSLGYCTTVTAAPSSCYSSYYITMSSPGAITVLAGQSIDVTVTISFS